MAVLYSPRLLELCFSAWNFWMRDVHLAGTFVSSYFWQDTSTLRFAHKIVSEFTTADKRPFTNDDLPFAMALLDSKQSHMSIVELQATDIHSL